MTFYGEGVVSPLSADSGIQPLCLEDISIDNLVMPVL
jgi:hypothetical protein